MRRERGMNVDECNDLFSAKIFKILKMATLQIKEKFTIISCDIVHTVLWHCVKT
jgi:hypothetical protein